MRQKDNIINQTKGMKLQATFYSDAARLWNKAPDPIKNSKTLYGAKKEIKKFVLTLPILTNLTSKFHYKSVFSLKKFK